MFNRSKPFVPVDVWLSITSHLQPQDVLNASMTCRDWYIGLAHQLVWQPLYATVLPGYPSKHFLIPNSVENVRRLDFIPLDGNEPHFLDHWPQSWKQRTVYVQHIIHVQSSAVAVLRKKTNSFEEDIDDEPFNDISKINDMEQYLDSPHPIDLVIFMYYFAHHLRVKQPEQCMELIMPLASGMQFDAYGTWKIMINTFDIKQFDRECAEFCPKRMENFPQSAAEFFFSLKLAPFARYSEYECDGHMDGLFVMLSKNDLPPSDLPDHIANNVYLINFSNVCNGLGKVFYVSVMEGHHYHIHHVSESFTDYFIHYTGVALEYGSVPQYEQDMGANDLIVPLSRDHSPRASILLPQPKDWDIGNYLPTYFTQEPDITLPYLFDNLDRRYSPELKATKPYPPFDNPDAIKFDYPPYDLFNGVMRMNWKPYHDLLTSLSPKMNRLADFGSGKLPERKHIEINQDIYDILQRKAQEWIAQTPSTIGTTRNFTEVEVEQIKQKTVTLQHLVQLHQRCLPISLYCTYSPSSLEYIETQKFLQDHMNGVALGTPKYSADDLDIIAARLQYQLNGLGRQIGRFPVRNVWYRVENRDLSNLDEFAWEYLE
ncbi:hypothetical protein BC943DRAFT_360784 [Umbelopsis sp. AD052]|nr:hypothetical protein BC943DRAFT_360784 [Umbelopsis sp. AD052]